MKLTLLSVALIMLVAVFTVGWSYVQPIQKYDTQPTMTYIHSVPGYVHSTWWAKAWKQEQIDIIVDKKWTDSRESFYIGWARSPINKIFNPLKEGDKVIIVIYKVNQ